jgi:hypothetical protein
MPLVYGPLVGMCVACKCRLEALGVLVIFTLQDACLVGTGCIGDTRWLHSTACCVTDISSSLRSSSKDISNVAFAIVSPGDVGGSSSCGFTEHLYLGCGMSSTTDTTPKGSFLDRQ